MHKKLSFLVMLVGILALSLAFTGCAGEEEVQPYQGEPLPYYFHGTWLGAQGGTPTQPDQWVTFTALTMTYNTVPYRIDLVELDESTPSDVSGMIEFYVYSTTYEYAGYIRFSGLNSTEPEEFYIDEFGATAPFFIPNFTRDTGIAYEKQ